MGIVTGYVPITADEVWDRVYPRSGAPKADLGSWTPDVVFLNYGENDASYSRKQGRPFPASFADRYCELVASVRRAYPSAEIVLLRGGMSGGATDPVLIAAWDEVVRRVEAGDPRVGHYAFVHWSAHHPRVADGEIMAGELVGWMRTRHGFPIPAAPGRP